MTNRMRPSALMQAGMRPAANRPAIDKLATTPMSMKSVDGGIKVDVAPAAARSAAANPAG